MDKKEILKGLSKSPYGFIANNYYQMSKEELKDIILEILAQFEDKEYEKVTEELIKNLIDCRDWEEE